MTMDLACQALAESRVIGLTYDGDELRFEVHSAGYSVDDPQVYGWQLSGSEGASGTGWRLLRLARASDMVMSPDRSSAPRAGYKPGDSIDRVVCCI
jgi:hypothetical protein